MHCTVLALLTIINRLSLLEQVIYMSLVGSFPFNAFLSGILSCIGSAVLAGAFLIQHLGFGYSLQVRAIGQGRKSQED